MPSTKDLSDLPMPSDIRHALRCCAMLDVVLCDEEWLRCYGFQPIWSNGVMMAKYDNGGGNDMFIFFRGTDAIIKGFDHESPVSPHAQEEFAVWPGIYDGVPANLNKLLDDAAVERDDVTFCTWYSSGQWNCGTMTFPNGEDDGSSYLLGTIHSSPDAYCDWASDYYERDLDKDVVASIYAGAEMSTDLIAKLNPERDHRRAATELLVFSD